MKAGFYSSKALLCVLLTLLGLAVASGPASAVTQYTITDLGTLGGAKSYASGVNSLGQVVGRAQTESGSYHAFFWENGVMYDLGTLGGAESEADAINSSGQIVGSAEYGASAYDHAFLYENGVMEDLDGVAGSISHAHDINELGQIVGTAGHAALWENDLIQDLGTLGGVHSTAYGINALGQVVGGAAPLSDEWHAFLWEDGVMVDLTPGHTILGEEARAINDSGQVVGFAGHYAFLWENGVRQNIGALGGSYSRAYGINNSGQVVGYAYTASETKHAFFWETGVMYDLNDLVLYGSEWSLIEAQDISDLGQIVGFGSVNGETHAFLLTPIPEPAGLGVVGLALLGAMRRLRRGISH